MDAEAVKSALADRAALYRMLATFYYAPLSQERIDALAAIDWDGLKTGDAEMDSGIDGIRRFFKRKSLSTRQILATDWTGAFAGVHTYEGRQAVPYASVFIDEAGELNTEQRGNVYHAYKSQALKVEDKASLPEDHLSYMLEFLAVLCERAVRDVDEADPDAFSQKMELSASFIEWNVLSWLNDFCEVAENLLQTRFYRGVLQLTRGYLRMELEELRSAA